MNVIVDNSYISVSASELTFAGVLRRYWVVLDEFEENIGVSSGWNEDTQKRYAEYYNSRILPLLTNGKALSAYTREEFENVVNTLKSNYKSEEGTNDHYEHLIKRVCQVGYEQHGIPNCWDDNKEDSRKELEDALGFVKRSFTRKEELDIFKRLVKPPEEISGEEIGLLLMMFTGVRNGEAAGMNFGDIYQSQEYNDMYYCEVNKKTRNNSNETEERLKTPNGYRQIPLPDVFVNYLIMYKSYVEECIKIGKLVLPEGMTINDIPIAHRNKAFLTRCSSVDLSRAGMELFEELGYRSEKITIAHAVENGVFINKGLIEKDPTTYIFRRHFCTRIKGLRFTDAEIHNCMGHSLINDKEIKNMFLDDDLKYEMYKKLKNHPLNLYASELNKFFVD